MAVNSDLSLRQRKLRHLHHVQNVGQGTDAIVRPTKVVEEYCNNNNSNNKLVEC